MVRVPAHREPTHPGEMLIEEFLSPMGLTQRELADSIHVPYQRINEIITDNMDWSTDEIVRASLDRYVVEEAFRQTKDDDLVAMMPLRHWTDGKIRCHILTCIVALAYLRVIEIRLKRAGLHMTAKTAMDSMQRLHSCLVWQGQQKKPGRIIEDPDPLQSQILRAFGYEINKGVLQPSDQ